VLPSALNRATATHQNQPTIKIAKEMAIREFQGVPFYFSKTEVSLSTRENMTSKTFRKSSRVLLTSHDLDLKEVQK
jgi:AAA+ ATPase superfamily predicted ATPase